MFASDDKMVPGHKLNAEDQRHALRAFVHRYTGQHKPGWVTGGMPNGDPYPVHFKDDADWLRHTLFHVKKNGRLNHQFAHCESHPTWPKNPELRDRFSMPEALL